MSGEGTAPRSPYLQGLARNLIDTAPEFAVRHRTPPTLARLEEVLGDLYSDDPTYNQDVAHELMRLMAREEARRLHATHYEETHADYDAEFLSADELDELPRPAPLIEGVLVRHAYGILRGRDASFKSFIALDWALSLATGTEWLGHASEQVKVLYVAGEGAYGLAERKRAWEKARGVTVEPDRFVVRKSAVNLYRGGPALEHLLEYVRAGGFGLVVLDTLRRMSGGADGNGSDMGVVVDNVDRIKNATDAGSVLVIAHTGKSDDDVRGFSGIEDDSDIVWAVKRTPGTNAVTLRCAKMKDGEDGSAFELQMRDVGTSLVPESGSAADETLRDGSPGHVSDQQILKAMRETFAITGASSADLIEMTGMSKSSVYRSRNRLLQDGWLRLDKARLYIGPRAEAASRVPQE